MQKNSTCGEYLSFPSLEVIGVHHCAFLRLAEQNCLTLRRSDVLPLPCLLLSPLCLSPTIYQFPRSIRLAPIYPFYSSKAAPILDLYLGAQ